MKIGIDVRCLMDEHYSGVSKYAANLLSAILEQDQENEYYLFYNSWRDLSARLAVWQRLNAKVIGSHYPNKIFNYFLQKLFSRPRVDRILGGVDIFFSPHFNFTSLSSGVKKIITVHDLSFLRYPNFFSGRQNFWHYALGVKRALRKADQIVAVSANTKNDIIELVGVAPEKISVIYSGNNLFPKTVSAQMISQFLEAKNIQGRFILYLGTIEPRKNISGLIQAFNQLKAKAQFTDLKLVLAGAQGWKNKSIYKEREASLYKKDIIFLGYISEVETEILYYRAQVFVYPSYYEGFGFPPLEAMAHGLPVVCSNVSSLPEVVGEAAILINPFKPEEITSALKIILTDEKVRQDLIEKGRVRAKMFFWDETARQYLKLFREL